MYRFDVNKPPQIKILQADPPSFALNFKVKERIGVCVINPRGLIKKKIVICA